MSDLLDAIGAIIDPPVWSNRARTEWERKRDATRRGYSLVKARKIAEVMAVQFTTWAQPEGSGGVVVGELVTVKRPTVRVMRNRFDVRHEYLQDDGEWMAASCNRPGFCRQCNVDGEREPSEFLAAAHDTSLPEDTCARSVVAAHLHIDPGTIRDDMALTATAFTRLRMSVELQVIYLSAVPDRDILGAATVGSLLALWRTDDAGTQG